MACGGSREIDITNIRSYYDNAYDYSQWAWSDYEDALYYWGIGQYNLSILSFYYAGSDVCNSLLYLAYKRTPYAPDTPIPHFLEYHTTGNGEVNMAAIINAMLAADPDEVLYFIGLVDAYRQSVWTKPFNKDFYAALARGFMEWE